jgi:hypothetical protein
MPLKMNHANFVDSSHLPHPKMDLSPFDWPFKETHLRDYRVDLAVIFQGRYKGCETTFQIFFDFLTLIFLKKRVLLSILKIKTYIYHTFWQILH